MNQEEVDSRAAKGLAIQELALDRIRESTSNPRRTFDEVQLRELAANIQSHGVLQPIVVRPSPLRLAFRRKHVRGFCRPFDRNCHSH